MEWQSEISMLWYLTTVSRKFKNGHVLTSGGALFGDLVVDMKTLAVKSLIPIPVLL